MTDDFHLVQFLEEMLRNRRFFVMLNNKRSRVRLRKNGLSQGSVLAPLLYNIYTNGQPLDTETKRFVYADDLCVTSRHSIFTAFKIAYQCSKRSAGLLRRKFSQSQPIKDPSVLLPHQEQRGEPPTEHHMAWKET